MAHPDGPIRQAPIEQIIPSQSALWNEQHAQRGALGLEGTNLIHVPNESAIIFHQYLPPPPTMIFEVGSAHGRDARWWASQGHTVHCVDFSEVALDQLALLAKQQGVAHNIVPILHDISIGILPPHAQDAWYHAFYARSALHVDDATLDQFTAALNKRLLPNAVIMIEGKSQEDHKIQRSVPIGCGLVADMHERGGHVRRVWSPECMATLADTHGWQVQSIEQHTEHFGPEPSVFLRLTARKI